MPSGNIRLAVCSDIPSIFNVRTSVVENHMSEEELAEIGITRESVATWLEYDSARA